MLYKDINLIPQKKKGLSAGRLFIYILLAFTVASYFGNYFVYEPLMKKKDAENKLERINYEIRSYGNVANDYINAQSDYARYTEKTEALKKVLDTDFKATDTIDAFFTACPNGVYIQNYSIKDNKVFIAALSESYEEIGEYLTSLDSTGHFDKIQYSAIGYQPYMEETRYSFSLTMDLIR